MRNKRKLRSSINGLKNTNRSNALPLRARFNALSILVVRTEFLALAKELQLSTTQREDAELLFKEM